MLVFGGVLPYTRFVPSCELSMAKVLIRLFSIERLPQCLRINRTLVDRPDLALEFVREFPTICTKGLLARVENNIETATKFIARNLPVAQSGYIAYSGDGCFSGWV